jgi:hypothetical protein
VAEPSRPQIGIDLGTRTLADHLILLPYSSVTEFLNDAGAGAPFAAAGRGIHIEYVVPTLPSRAARSWVRRRQLLKIIYFLRTLGGPENT